VPAFGAFVAVSGATRRPRIPAIVWPLATVLTMFAALAFVTGTLVFAASTGSGVVPQALNSEVAVAPATSEAPTAPAMSEPAPAESPIVAAELQSKRREPATGPDWAALLGPELDALASVKAPAKEVEKPEPANVGRVPAKVKPVLAGTCGTAIDFVSNLAEAAARAKQEHKLLFVLHVSGNFEEPGFT